MKKHLSLTTGSLRSYSIGQLLLLFCFIGLITAAPLHAQGSWVLQQTIKPGYSVEAVTFSPDGTKLATAVTNTKVTKPWQTSGYAQVWNASTGAHIRTFHTNSLTRSVTFSPDNTNLAVGSNNTSGIYNISTGAMVKYFPTNSQVFSIAFDPHDATSVAAACQDGYVRIFDISGTGSTAVLDTALTTGTLSTWSIAYSPNSTESVLAAGCHSIYSAGTYSAYIRTWNTTNWDILADLKSTQGPINTIAYSLPTGSYLAGGSVNVDEKVNIWDTDTNEISDTIPGTSSMLSVAFNPEYAVFAVGTEAGEVKLYNTSGWSYIANYSYHTDMVNSVAFSPDGTKMATASGDGTVELWQYQEN